MGIKGLTFYIFVEIIKYAISDQIKYIEMHGFIHICFLKNLFSSKIIFEINKKSNTLTFPVLQILPMRTHII